jgi:hypothetical protein
VITALTPSSERFTAGARVLDRAEGVLVGLRRCRVESAFDEVIGASKQHVLPALRVARALVELSECRQPSDLDAATAAREQWGDLRSTRTSSWASSSNQGR